jgi:hypothetical protein
MSIVTITTALRAISGEKQDSRQKTLTPEATHDPDIWDTPGLYVILHKLMEEVLTAETSATGAALYRRAGELIAQLGLEPNSDPASGISPGELAAAMERTLNLAEIAQLRERLVPEHTIFARESSPAGEILVSGIADAVALDAEGGIETIVDWKSDVAPNQSTIAHYFKQIDEYRRHTGAKRALLVLITPGRIMEARQARA